MKKILLTCTDLMAIQFFTEHISHWVQSGYCVHLACSAVGGRLEDIKELYKDEKNVSVSVLSLQRSPFSFSNYKGYKELKEHLKHNHYDCIVTNEPVMGLVTRLAARKYDTRVIYIAHGFHFYKGGSAFKNTIFKTIERFAARYTNTLITINTEDYKAAQSFRLRKNGTIHLLPGIGVNTKRFSPAVSDQRKIMRTALGLQQDEIGIAVIGELNDNKNQQVLIRAMEILIKKHPEAKLLLLGKGDNLSTYEALAASCNVRDHVIFLGYRKDVPQVLSACDIGVSASYREGLPLNLIEEMATGLPIVASVNRGHVDILDEHKGGLFCRENTPEAFAEAFACLCQDERMRKAYGEYNLEHCKRFDISIVKERLLNLIDS